MAAGLDKITVYQAAQDALQYFKQHDVSNYDILMEPKNSEEFKKIVAGTEKAAAEGLPSNNDPEQPTKNLSEERIKMIEEGLTIPTYVMTIRNEGDQPYVDITRNGEPFMESVFLSSKESTHEMNNFQIASIVIEVVALIAQAIGIHVKFSHKVLKELAIKLSAVVTKSAELLVAINALRKAIKKGTRMQQAQAIWDVSKACYNGGILWDVLKAIFFNMTFWDWVQSALQIVGILVASIPTEGLALVGRIVLALATAGIFVLKLLNLDWFEERIKSIEHSAVNPSEQSS